MADKRPPRHDDHEPYEPLPCPDADRASALERLYWEHVEELRVDMSDARADRGHTAVTSMQAGKLAAAEKYHAARSARIADEESRKSRGDIVARIVQAFGTMPIAQQDEVLAQLTEAVRVRG